VDATKRYAVDKNSELTYPTNYLRMYWSELRQSFRIGKNMGGVTELTFVLRSFKDGAVVTNFGATRRCYHRPPSLFALAFDNGFNDREAMAMIHRHCVQIWRAFAPYTSEITTLEVTNSQKTPMSRIGIRIQVMHRWYHMTDFNILLCWVALHWRWKLNLPK